ncbi:hypothetical protein LTR85_011558 [Meristemomyces frigidus]|nr:hypothetical protein LTR85_011558 [Meristemomyces frigidus]
MEAIPIQNLDPSVAPPAGRSIRAVVTLSWPYSSSTRQCAFLLADPDARLRSRKGQVRVRFTGASAEAIANSRIGISDEVMLRLEGATWAARDGVGTRTPGRSVDGELEYSRRLSLIVARTGGEVEVSVDAPLSPPRSMYGVEETVQSTPMPRAVTGLRSSLDGGAGGVPIYSSPAFAKRLRLSGEYFLDSAYDPFMDGANDAQLKKRLQTSFGGTGQWRYAERTPSPVKDAFERDNEPFLQQPAPTDGRQSSDVTMLDGTHDEEAGATVTDRKSTPEVSAQPAIETVFAAAKQPPRDMSPHEGFTTIGDTPEVQEQAAQMFADMPPPPLPCLRMPHTQGVAPQDLEVEDHNAERQQSPSTPKLQAVHNSALPLPSPFPSEAVQPLFEQAEPEPEPSPDSPGESATVLEDGVQTGNDAGTREPVIDANKSRSAPEVAEPPEPEEREDGFLKPDDRDEDHDVRPTERELRRTGQKPIPAPETKPEERLGDEPKVPQQQPLPHTPAKLPPSEFSLDGAAPAAPQSQATPQSERDRVMARTFKSLFGFRASPEPQPLRSAQPEPATPTPTLGLSDMARARCGAAGVKVQDERPAMAKEPEILETQQEDGAFADEIAQGDAQALPLSASSPTMDDYAAQDTNAHESQQRESDMELQSSPADAATTSGRDEARELRSSATITYSAVAADRLEAQESRREVKQSSPAPTSHSDVQQGNQTPDERAMPQPQLKPAVTSEVKQPQSSAVTVIELDSSSDVEQAVPTAQEKDRQMKAEAADVVARPDDVVEAETDLSSPLATSQLDELEDEVMHEAMDDSPAGHTPMEAADLASSQQPFSSSPAPKTIEQLAQGRELFPGGPIAYFPTERVIEDSQDEVSATLSTLPTPTADEEDVITVPDRVPSEKPARFASSPLDAHAHDVDEMEDMDTTPTAPVMSKLDEGHAPPQSTSQTTVIELGSSLPVEESMHFPLEAIGQSSPAPLTQIRIDDMSYEQQDAGTPTELQPSSPAEELAPSMETTTPTPPASLAQLASDGLAPRQTSVEAESGQPIEQIAEKSTPSPPVSVTQVRPDWSAPGLLEVEAAIEIVSSSPVEEATPFAEASKLTNFSLAEQAQDTGQDHLDGETALEGDFMDDFVEADMLGSPSQAQRTVAAESEPEDATEVNESIPFETQIPMDLTSYESQEDITHLPTIEVADAVSYPTLPPSPLASQPRQESYSSQVMQQAQSETIASVLPPTPQLTQAESDVRTLESQVGVSQESVGATLQVETDHLVLDTSPRAEQEAMTPFPRALHENHIHAPSDKRTPIATAMKKTPARKSLTARLSNVPDVISAWFSPKRSSGISEHTPIRQSSTLGRVAEDDAASIAEAPEINGGSMARVNGHSAEAAERVELQSNGISTAMEYFTPLSRLEGHLNPSSQQAYGTSTIDVLAVITDSTKPPERAKTGQRDYFTIFRISEASLPAGTNIRVEVFRPWKAKLPVAKVGDVVLLRAFGVKSRKRQPYLLSTDASSWCVWRFADAKIAEENEVKPVWARKRSNSASLGVREEVKGPPVELGDEERQHARALREWWVALHPEMQSEHHTVEREDVGTSGLVSPQLTTKL